MKNTTQFYAYLWLREDGPPKDHSRIVIINCRNEQDAFNTKIELISNWGRKDNGTGVLWNFTDGGEGSSGSVGGNKGKKASPETIAKLRESHLGQVAWNKGKKGSTSGWPKGELRGKTWNKGISAPAEVRKKMSEAKKGKPWTEARRAAQYAK
jgi:hypothetical protein